MGGRAAIYLRVGKGERYPENQRPDIERVVSCGKLASIESGVLRAGSRESGCLQPQLHGSPCRPTAKFVGLRQLCAWHALSTPRCDGTVTAIAGRCGLPAVVGAASEMPAGPSLAMCQEASRSGPGPVHVEPLRAAWIHAE